MVAYLVPKGVRPSPRNDAQEQAARLCRDELGRLTHPACECRVRVSGSTPQPPCGVRPASLTLPELSAATSCPEMTELLQMWELDS